VVEAAFVLTEEDSILRGQHIGLNWAVPLSNPLQGTHWHSGLDAVLAKHRIDEDDHICLALHLISPRFAFKDCGKGSIILPWEFSEAVRNAVLDVTKVWSKIKKQQERTSSRLLERWIVCYTDGTTASRSKMPRTR
jgi:hypothetical protein